MANPLIDLLRQIQNPEEGTDLTPIIEQLSTGIEGQSSVLSDREATIGELNTEVSRLKGVNYDLMTKIPLNETEIPQEQHDEKPIGINDLFKKKGGE